MRFIPVLLTMLVISACSSVPPDEVNRRITAWQGIQIDELIRYWGLPTRKQKIDGRRYAEWTNRSSEPGNTSLSIGTGSRSRHSAIGIGVTLFDLGGSDDVCSRLVEYDQQGKVIRIQWSGTAELCYRLTPERSKVTAKPVMSEQ